jgi:hypothetical protein
VVSMRAESVAVGCFDSVLTERLQNLESKFCIVAISTCGLVAKIENYASKKRADIATSKMKCIFLNSRRLRLTTNAPTLQAFERSCSGPKVQPHAPLYNLLLIPMK